MGDRNEKRLEMYNRVYSLSGLPTLLKTLCAGAVILTAVSFVVFFTVNAMYDYIAGIKIILSAMIPFIAVSVMRKLINAKRPYEVYSLDRMNEEFRRAKRGESFPSRHVFSAFCIGTLIMQWSVILGASVILLGVLIAAVRVMLGVHFTRDVIVGAVIGVASGVVGILIL